MNIINFIIYLLKDILRKLNKNDFYFWFGFLFFPYLIGIPVWYLMTDYPQPLWIEVLAPWFVGLVCFSSIPLIILIFAILTWPLYYIRNLWREWNHD
jgi:hypothetical protein